ncbi:uncharacterized protein (DUF1501 family) [Breoghania corrubedonensis]|uniref:Uncharacterized protein (DUF1501 family) n=1 Tax=Breoghania corrubedonensis TaxID=665038 RepID=A0A2T5V6N6_9HYPH|nr:DUF1501 domain-containing protein [Breoghania corrubedonensis]PTW59415.1 uncharacterized protein (DUF1501 family) [Breoghania corrubedonensis]
MNVCDYSRRQFMVGTAGLVAWAYQTRIAAAAPGRDPRLLVVNLRGGMDGLGAVAPVGDPDYHRLRGEAVLSADDPAHGLPLDDLFVLHPSLPTLHGLYRDGHALIAHAVATPYRDRSHFDAQDVLESGAAAVGQSHTGWLNRALAALPHGESIGASPAPALSIGAQVPLLLRGQAEVMSWMPPGFPAADGDLRARLLDLYRHTDPGLLATFEAALDLDRATGGEMEVVREIRAVTPDLKGPEMLARMTARTVGKLMVEPGGPRIGSMEILGWDTHVDGEPFDARFVRQMARLDRVIADLHTNLAPVWDQTVICLMTEFGRTVRYNGAGTDHGVGTVAILLGGAVSGGRVLADWPGLSEAALFENRDLRPTLDVRTLFKGVLADHLGLSDRVLAQTVFPDSAGAKPVRGLLQG